MARMVFAFLIFPGFVFSSILGLFSTWVDRKVTAQVQWRVGPPPLQPFYDFLKLMGKETLLPASGNRVVSWPRRSFPGGCDAGLDDPLAGQPHRQHFRRGPDRGRVPPAHPLPFPHSGGIALGNPLATTGASREMKLILAYELPS